MDEASLEEFKQIFERFTKVADEASGAAADAAEAEAEAAEAAAAAAAAAAKSKRAAEGGGIDSDDDSDEEGAGPRLSRKQRKLKSRLSVAELKQLVQRPDVVEAHDVTAADPRMLVFLKVRFGRRGGCRDVGVGRRVVDGTGTKHTIMARHFFRLLRMVHLVFIQLSRKLGNILFFGMVAL